MYYGSVNKTWGLTYKYKKKCVVRKLQLATVVLRLKNGEKLRQLFVPVVSSYF